MTKPHSKFVKAMGNGSYTWVALLRSVGIAGFLAILGTVYWAGSTASSVEANIKAQTEALKAFVKNQAARDIRQDDRISEQNQRLEAILQRLLDKPRP